MEDLCQYIARAKADSLNRDYIFLSAKRDLNFVNVYFIRSSDKYFLIIAYEMLNTAIVHKRVHVNDIKPFQLTYRIKQEITNYCFEFDKASCIHEIWPFLKDISDYCMVDNTKHLDICKGLFYFVPIALQEDTFLDIKCGSCFASLDFKWTKGMNPSDYARFIKRKEIWHLWRNMNSLVYWIPEEVLQNDIDIFLKNK
jgi:hypothetical protein